jgi:hypothetical protein
VKHRNFHPEICKLLDELDGLRGAADLRARDLLRDDHERGISRATADAYDYCMMRIRDLNIEEVAQCCQYTCETSRP